MSDDLYFVDNFCDFSIQFGIGVGFQFEFYCECCNDIWCLLFELYKSGCVFGWMQEISGLFGNLFGGVGYSVDNVVDGLVWVGWGMVCDDVFWYVIDVVKWYFYCCV